MREELDTFAARSHQLAHQARQSGAFAREIVPIRTTAGIVTQDETIRPDTTMQRLSTLKPVFRSEEMSARFPQIRCHPTAGNASQMTDGAAALLIVSEGVAARLGLRVRARFVGFDVCGDNRLTMLTAPIRSSQRVLRKSRLKIDDIAHYEINEVFAPAPLTWLHELKADPACLNRAAARA